MYKLLIADDEPWLRKRLMLTIDWESMGVTELYEAEDGAEAFMLATEHEPDIIITDIDMPELTGIDLMRTLNESALSPQIILISGYNEFEYARSAIQFGAVDYLLKPVDEEELKRIICKCIATLEQNRYNKGILDCLSSSSDLLREKIYADLLLGKLDFGKVPTSRLRELGIVFTARSAMCILAHSHPASQKLSENNVEETLIEFGITDNIRTCLAARFGEVLMLRMEDANAYLVFSDLDSGEFSAGVSEALADAKKKINELYSVRLAYGVGSVAHSLAELCPSYREARYRINLCSSQRGAAPSTDEHAKVNDFQVVYEEYNIKSLVASLKNGSAEEALRLLKELISEFLRHSDNDPSPLQVRLFYLNVLNSLLKGCLPFLPVREDVINICMEYIGEPAPAPNVNRMHARLQGLVAFLLEQYQRFIGSKRHWLIDKIIQYINEHYTAALTMSDVAGAFYLNPSYFCKLFKEETGVTFTKYLMSVRVQNAKNLMSDSSLKLYDVASAVGYTNVQYFSTVFKEIEGVTPSQYRLGG